MRLFLLGTLVAGCANDPETDDTACTISVCGGDVVWHAAEVCLTGTACCAQDEPTFTWSFESIPEASILDDSAFGEWNGTSAASTVCFVPDAVGTYVIGLVVSDGVRTSAPDYLVVEVMAENKPPVAACDPPEDGHVGDLLEFDGSGSYDPEGTTLLYDWSLSSAPKGSLINSQDIQDRTSAVAHLIPDVEGTWVLTLVVSDGEATSEPCLASVEVEPSSGR